MKTRAAYIAHAELVRSCLPPHHAAMLDGSLAAIGEACGQDAQLIAKLERECADHARFRAALGRYAATLEIEAAPVVELHVVPTLSPPADPEAATPAPSPGAPGVAAEHGVGGGDVVMEGAE